MIKNSYDLIIIGGGATGSGIALDATLRGLNCLVLEQNDFSQGTSSRSTKLVHGGVRYLEAAIKNFDLAQFKLVKEGLKERYRLLDNASFLAKPMSLITPLYKYYEIPYIYIGLSIYDFISGKKTLGRSSILSKKNIIKNFPYVKKEGLKGGVKYYDGTFNDSRMVISLLQTAKEVGCDIFNYKKVTGFLYNNNIINGVKVEDKFTNKIIEISSKYVINATGVFGDNIRKMDDKTAREILKTSSGLHIIIDKKFLPNDSGVMIPKTQDGRVLFILPYRGKCLVGTTDENATVSEKPEVEEKDIDYILMHLTIYFDINISKKDILSSWVGLRPLVIGNTSENTKEIVREHFVEVSRSNLISIVGGKWTTYRKMAEDTLDTLIQHNQQLSLKKCKTKKYKLIGNQLDTKEFKIKLDNLNLEEDLKTYLLETYGDQIIKVSSYIEKIGYHKLHPNYLISTAEVYYCIDHEFVQTANDFLIRRINLGLIDNQASKQCLEEVTNIINNTNLKNQ